MFRIPKLTLLTVPLNSFQDSALLLVMPFSAFVLGWRKVLLNTKISLDYIKLYVKYKV